MSNTSRPDSFGVKKHLQTAMGEVAYYSLEAFAAQGFPAVRRLPFSIRILLESILRHEDNFQVTSDHARILGTYDPASPAREELPFKPARVLLQDFTGVPSVVDLAAMRSAMARMGGDPARINPQVRHSINRAHTNIDHDYLPSL